MQSRVLTAVARALARQLGRWAEVLARRAEAWRPDGDRDESGPPADWLRRVRRAGNVQWLDFDAEAERPAPPAHGATAATRHLADGRRRHAAVPRAQPPPRPTPPEPDPAPVGEAMQPSEAPRLAPRGRDTHAAGTLLARTPQAREPLGTRASDGQRPKPEHPDVGPPEARPTEDRDEAGEPPAVPHPLSPSVAPEETRRSARRYAAPRLQHTPPASQQGSGPMPPAPRPQPGRATRREPESRPAEASEATAFASTPPPRDAPEGMPQSGWPVSGQRHARAERVSAASRLRQGSRHPGPEPTASRAPYAAVPEPGLWPEVGPTQRAQSGALQPERLIADNSQPEPLAPARSPEVAQADVNHWPTLVEIEPDDEDAEAGWEVLQRELSHRRRLDREQRGDPWNASHS